MRAAAGLAAVLLLLAWTSPAVADEPAPPERAWTIEPASFLPPVRPWHGKSESLAVPADDPWATPCEKSGFAESPDYDDTIAWLRRLSDASPHLRMVSIGRSREGRDIWMVVATEGGLEHPKHLRENGKPTVLFQAGIHSGEIDGKDAGMMLLRDLTVRKKLPGLLEKVNVLFVPILSVDAHERRSEYGRINQRGPRVMGWRTNARNLNLNRDYAKVDTREIRAIVQALDEWPVDLYLDIHVTDGADYQYDVTFGWNGRHAWSPAIATWLDEVFRPRVSKDLEAWGHVPGPTIFQVDRLDPGKGIWDWTASPRFSTGYGDARHLPTVLVENHSLKPFRRRVLGTRVLMESVLRLLADEGSSLRRAIEEDRARRRAEVPLEFEVNPEDHRKMLYRAIEVAPHLSEISGSVIPRWTGRPLDVEVPIRAQTKVKTAVRRPAAYLVPPAWGHVVDRLRLHGVKVEYLRQPETVEVEVYRLADPELDRQPYEGHVRVRAKTTLERRTMTFPKGTARISTDQPLGDLVVLLLEPQSPDSFFQWGFFLPVLQRAEYFEAYAMEPLARRMLAKDPELRREFLEKLRKDPEFRGDPRARLEWFYRKTPWYDDRYLLYPVARVPVPARGEGAQRATKIGATGETGVGAQRAAPVSPGGRPWWRPFGPHGSSTLDPYGLTAIAETGVGAQRAAPVCREAAPMAGLRTRHGLSATAVEVARRGDASIGTGEGGR